MICPICNKELQMTDNICPICGFEIHIYPEDDAVVAEYEKARVENYKKIWETLEEGQGIRGFLVVMVEEESLEGIKQRRIKDVFPVYQGKNVFGRNPNADSAVHTQRILYCREMQAEHFAIESKSDNSFVIQNISGTSHLRNKSNRLDNKETELCNGDEIFLGNLIFAFNSK